MNIGRSENIEQIESISLTRYQGADMNNLVARCIISYGWAAEHNADDFFHSAEPTSESAFFFTPEGFGVLVQLYRDDWWLFAEPMAPCSMRAPLIKELCRQAFANSGIKKVVVELSSSTRLALLRILSPEFRAAAIAETLVWPVLNLKTYDTSYGGHAYKSLRNVRNRFYRQHSVAIRDAREAPKDDLHDIVRKWKTGRHASHRDIVASYHGAIDNCFNGTYSAHIVIVDGTAEALNAGWPIPHSHRYYLATSIHTYAHWGLGEFSFMKELEWLKDENFQAVDLGGSDKKLFAFKKQFGEVTTYRTHRFSIYRIPHVRS